MGVSLFVKARLRWGKECRDYRISAVATTGQLARKPAVQLKVQWGNFPSWIKKTSTAYVTHSFLSCYFVFLTLVGFIKTLKELDEIVQPKHVWGFFLMENTSSVAQKHFVNLFYFLHIFHIKRYAPNI